MEKKMSFLKKLVVFFVIISVFFGCSRYKIYDFAIESTRKKADLEFSKIKIPQGEIVYLSNFNSKTNKKNQEYLILVHGFGSNKDSWLKFSDELKDEFKIAALDLPGHGESFFEQSLEYTINNQAGWLRDFMDSLEIEKAHLIGNSMGGAISLKFASKFPKKITTLTLIDSAGIFKTETEFTKALEKGENPLVVENKKEFDELMDLVMEKKPYIPGPVYKVLAEKKINRKSKDQKIFNDMSKDIYDLSGEAENLKIPALILWGEKDKILNVDNGFEFGKKIKKSKVVVFEKTGHLPMMEVPEKSAEAFREFVLAN
jgi:pimeloyl-ACP methyl ester carboxylesterase